MLQLRRRSFRAALGLTASVLATLPTPSVGLAQTSDPAGDFLAGYLGPKGADLDVLSAQAFFNGSQFLFTSTQNGPVGTTPNGVFVWGINRGSGTSPGGVFAANTKFDAVVVFNPAGGSFVRDLPAAISTPLTNVLVGGNTISGTVDLSLLPSTGFAATDYEGNLWPRINGGPATNIADFASDTTNFGVTVTPEPGTAVLALAGLLAVGVVARRKRLA